MTIHFNTRTAAEAHLTGNGFRQIKSGNWVSRDGYCAASIHPVSSAEVVMVAYWQVAA
jgi:hypothetical protein